MTKKERIKRLLARGVEEVIDRAHLERALSGTKKLRVKHGIDPTGPKIHIGRAIVLWKLREFQELGHKVVLIIGDFTAQVGDPSDKLEKRPMLTREAIKKNLKEYLPQIGKILDLEEVEVKYNSEWLAKLDFEELSELTELFTVQQMVRRRNFKERWDKGKDITLRELLYPALQGYDSVAVEADIELGGSDQLFNLLAGRKVQEHYGQRPQDILTTKMLVGTDGRKMSTSWGNVINITDSPDEQYGKAMSVHDDLIVEYFELATDVREDRKDLKQIKGIDKKELKERLAFEIVCRYHGEEAAEQAAEKFEKLFSEKDTAKVSMKEIVLPKEISPLEIAVKTRLEISGSRSAARRLIEQGGLSIDGKRVKDPNEKVQFKGGEVLKVGKKHFFRIKLK